MTPAEFDQGLTELCSFFGEKAYAPKMIKMIEAIVRPLTRSEFGQVVETLAQTHHKVPTPAQIKQASFPFLQRAHERERQARVADLNAGERCEYCGNSGVIIALLKTDPRYEFSFGCTKCHAYEARRLRHPPLWDDGYREKYIPTSLRRESFEAAARLRSETFAKMQPKGKDRASAIDVRQSIAGLADRFTTRRERGQERREERQRAADAGGCAPDQAGAQGVGCEAMPAPRDLEELSLEAD